MSQNQYEKPELGKSGCYASLNEQTADFELPLRSFSYDIDIVDCFANVKMTQTYYNSQDKVLDVQYIFPIHPNSTVSNLEIHFGGNVTQGVILEKEKAERQFQEHVKEGTGAAYVDYNPQSRDIMKMKVGNIQPKQEIKVILSYVHLNSLVCNTFYEYRLASTMTPRYARTLPQNKLANKSLANNVEGKCNWAINVAVRSARKIVKIESISHKVKIAQKQNSCEVKFADQELPNKDFSLYYSIENFEKPKYILSNSDSNTAAAISFIPKYCQLSVDDALKQAKLGKTFEVDLDSSKGEYFFLLDRSGSMNGIRIENAVRSLEVFLRSLPEDSYFNVLSFGSEYEYLFKESARNLKAEIDKAVIEISKMEADLGGTEILDAIKSLVKRPVIPGYPRQLFFLTDGAVSNVSEVLQFIAKHTQYTRVNSIGIGNGCSEELIQGCAQQGKGYYTFIKDDEKPQQKIVTMLQNTLSPVISKVQLIYNKSKVESIVPNPDKMPYILKNDLANFYINFNGVITEPFELTIKYQESTGKTFNEKIVIDPKTQTQYKWIHQLINYQKIRALTDSLEYREDEEDRIFYVKKLDKDGLKEQIIKQSIKHQILTDHTAFLCVDTQVADNLKKLSTLNPKEIINIKGMNPYDHVVTFCNQKEGYGYGEDDSDCYINECCVTPYEAPPEELRNITKFEEAPKRYRPMKMMAKIAGEQGKYIAIQGITQLPNPEKKLAYSYIIKQQEADGSWREDFINSLFVNYAEMQKTFGSLTDKISVITFLVCQYLDRYFHNEPQFAMIIKKGKNYINKNSKRKWVELEAEFHKKFYEAIKD